MLDKNTYILDIRGSRRKKQINTRCRIDGDEQSYKVYELSAHGFSFICPKSFCRYCNWEQLGAITIVNEEEIEIISGEGRIVHVTEFDRRNYQIGVYYTKKRFDRTITGRVRVPRHYPLIHLNAAILPNDSKNQSQLYGIVKDYTASAARITIEEGDGDVFQTGDEVKVTIHHGKKTFYDGYAHIIRKRNDSTELVLCFSSKLLDVTHLETVTSAIQNEKAVRLSLESMNDYKDVDDAFKALISDWRIYYQRLKQVLDKEENKRNYELASQKESFLVGFEEGILADHRGFITRLNTFTNELESKDGLSYRKYFRENLTPYIRLAPLAASIIDKDNGYAGDYETIKQFFQNSYAGDSMFSKIMNHIIASTDAVKAHKKRIDFLVDQLNEAYAAEEENFSLLTLGSGPAEEILRFIVQHSFDKPTNATLIDMDAFALADFSDRLQYVPKDNFQIDLVNINILKILRKNGNDPVNDTYKFTYCAGLFDYFKDGICQRLVRYLIKHTKPGGTVIITNVHVDNHTRYFMDCAGNWQIIHRDDEEMKALIPPDHHSEIYRDETGANVFCKIRV